MARLNIDEAEFNKFYSMNCNFFKFFNLNL